MSSPLPNYDATFCGKLPLHQTNLIQPHGCLFVLDAGTRTILQVSDNVAAYAGRPAPQLVGTPFDQLADTATIGQLEQFSKGTAGARQPLQVVFQESALPCSALVHEKEGLLFVELHDPSLDAIHGRSFLEVYQELRTLMQQLEPITEIADFAAVVVQQLQLLTGFDKVMVYAFDSDWNGTVIGESKAESMDAYMGLRFPASDIPKPARALYLKNAYRFIANSRYQPVRLYPLLNPRTHALTDLTGCDLRSVAAVHLEYLQNMGVSASLSLRLVHNGQLWGLISCHHRDPKYFSFEALGVFELLSGILSAQLSRLLNKAWSLQLGRLQERLTQLVPALNGSTSLQEALGRQAQQVLELLDAPGLAFNLNGHIEAIGQVPESNDLHRLFYWLQVQEPQHLVHQPSLSQVFEEAADFAPVGSGMLALPVVPQRGQFVVAFRPEVVQEVAWGGNPHDALQMDADGKTYHPRNSFAVWKQIVRNTARPWSAEELSIAEAFKNVLTGIALRHLHA